jgi:negative regulator of flagellin synthesis FlgM
MQINGPYHVHGPQSISSPHRAQAAQPRSETAPSRGVDQLDISPEAEFVSRIRDVPDIRADRVAQVRQAIESGRYETPDKLDIAIERLLDEIA